MVAALAGPVAEVLPASVTVSSSCRSLLPGLWVLLLHSMLSQQCNSDNLGWETFLFFSTEGSFGPRLTDVRQAKGTATCVFLSSQEKDCSAVSPSVACSCQIEHCVPTLLLKVLSDLIVASLTRDPKCHTAKGIFPSTWQQDC